MSNMIDVKSRMRRSLGAGVAVAALGMGVLAAGRPAMATPATMSFYPTTDVYPKDVLHLDVDYYVDTKFKNTAFSNYGLTYGTGPDHDGALGRSEVGFDYVASPFQGVNIGKRLWFNAKTQLYNNDKSAVRVVTGVWGVGARGNLGTGDTTLPPDVGYLLASKNFSFGRIHAGIAHSFANKAVIATPAGNTDRTYLQLDYDKYISKNVQVGVDFYSGKSAISVLAPVVYYYLNPNTSFLVSYVRFNDKSIGPSRNQIYLAFDYNFGRGANPKPAEAPAAAPAK